MAMENKNRCFRFQINYFVIILERSDKDHLMHHPSFTYFYLNTLNIIIAFGWNNLTSQEYFIWDNTFHCFYFYFLMIWDSKICVGFVPKSFLKLKYTLTTLHYFRFHIATAQEYGNFYGLKMQNTNIHILSSFNLRILQVMYNWNWSTQDILQQLLSWQT